VAARFLQVPQGDGGLQAFFDDAAGGSGGTLSAAELLHLTVEKLDLPRAVGRLVVKRSMQRQGGMDGSEGAAGSGTEMVAEEVRVGYAAFHAVYGRHRPEETDRVRLFRLLKQPASSWLVKSDIVDLVWAVSETHSGLAFLRDSAGEFLEAYVKTTALRIMWALSASGTGKIALQRWRHSAITEVLFELDEEADINLARDFFSYNHFYVIWCLFWELDEDEDSLLQKEDLLRYGSYGLTSIVVERIWVLRHQRDSGGMTYDDFVYFLLAEEDKQSSPAYQYWFHVLDLNGDGALDQRDLGIFYDELRPRIEAMGEEVVSFDELINEFIDICRPEQRGHMRLSEIKKSALGYNIFSAITNVRKYIAWEGLSCEKAAGRASNLRDTRDWDLFADSEYRRLVQSEEEKDDDEAEEEDSSSSSSNPEVVEQSV